MPTSKVPLTMGNKPVGFMEIDLETGLYSGQIDKELADILVKGMGEKLYEVAFLGKAAHPTSAMEAHEEFRLYLEKDCD